MNYARHTFYISSVYKVNSLAYTAQRVRSHTGWLVHWPYRNRAEKYDPSIRTPHIS